MSQHQDEVLKGIKSVESSGDYGAQNPKSSASGAYQFTDPTWKDTVSKETFEQYPHTKDAPEEVQNHAAQDHIEDLSKQMEGNTHDTIRAWEQGAAGAKRDHNAGKPYAQKVESRMEDGR